MANTPNEIVKNAKKMISDGYVYVYGYKGTKVRKDEVMALSKQYPSVFSSSILKMALAKVGKIGIDCSGFVNKAAGTNLGGSYQINEAAPRSWDISNPKNIKSGMYCWRTGHIGILEVDSDGVIWILEAMGTAYDLRRTKFSERGSHFMKYGEIKGVDYSSAKTSEQIKTSKKINTSYATITARCRLYKNATTTKGSYGTLSKDTVIVFVKDMGNGWSKVTTAINLKNCTGYVKNTCVGAKKNLSTYKKAVVVADKANVHEKNKKTSKTIAVLTKGAEVTVVSQGKYWWNVKFKRSGESYDAFIFHSRLKLK